MWDVLKNVARRRRRTTVVLSTHSMEECEALCNRTIIMVNGVIRCTCFQYLIAFQKRFGLPNILIFLLM